MVVLNSASDEIGEPVTDKWIDRWMMKPKFIYFTFSEKRDKKRLKLRDNVTVNVYCLKSDADVYCV